MTMNKDVSRKLVVLESSVERSEDRAGHSQHKIDKLEEELRLLNNVLKTYEHNEQKAIQREESYEEQIRDLSHRLKDAEQRADLGERTMAKLQKEVDRLEDELLAEKEKYKNISEELDQTLNELQGY
ncbi:Tropomyosin [Brachionus plicatilis]|uniref:Tropomyosin n=1 Tax=Brachionus plicatilis TaxID=10195 RepID=A0A3M7QKJ6_BRAPC|nr:Tropomyosin [Brachionus plicatilis]